MFTSIRRLAIGGISFVIIVIISSYMISSSYLLNETFTYYETDSLIDDIGRVRNTLNEEIKRLAEISLDWSMWDDSVEFVNKNKKDFIATNLNEKTFNNLNLYYIAFLNSNNDIIYQKLKCEDNSYTDNPNIDTEYLVNMSLTLLRKNKDASPVNGYILIDNKIIIITAYPIKYSDGTGDNQGHLIMSRLVDSSFLNDISGRILIKFKFVSSTHKPTDTRKSVHTVKDIGSENDIEICDVNDDEFAGIELIEDITGNRSLKIIVYHDKDIAKRGNKTLFFNRTILVLSTLILLVCIITFVDKVILKRIYSISNQLKNLAKNYPTLQHTEHIQTIGNDELRHLADNINFFIDEVWHYKLNLEDLVSEKVIHLNDEIAKNTLMLEELGKAKNIAELASQYKTDFLAKATHELRTPLNAINGMNEYLLTTDLTPDQRDCLTTSKDASNHLLSTINDLLDLSKIEAGKISIRKVSFDINRLLETTTKILNSIAASKKLWVHYNFENETLNFIKSDPARLRQIIFNILYNAIKFTKDGGIDLSCTIKSIENSKTVNCIICIKDTGIGISSDKLNEIFSPYSQAFTSISQEYGGTGLGLTISKRLVELLGGELKVTSKEGFGSEFCMYFTFETGDEEEYFLEANSSLLPIDKAKLNILVVDDNLINLKVAKKIFSLLKLTPKLVTGGHDAISALQEKQFDVVFLDIEMPELSGFDVAKIIRNKKTVPLNHDIYIIAMTAHSLKSFQEKCFSVGMNDYITKPIDLSELSSKLQILVKHKYVHVIPDEKKDVFSDGNNPKILNIEKALEQIGHDLDLYFDICINFLEKYNSERVEILYIKHSCDSDEVRLFAHNLKSISRQIGAERVSKIAEVIENYALENKIEHIYASFIDLKIELKNVENYLEKYLSQNYH